MLAPEPFFQPRGTPISIYFRIRALADLGHNIDLVTYHLGKNKTIKNLKILRIPDLFFIKKIKIGPSFAKIPLDFLLLLRAMFQLTIKPYDLIFSHEEAGFFGAALGKIWNIPHIYDMHSSLPQQLDNFEFSKSRHIKGLFLWIEKFILKNSNTIIVICPDLSQTVQKLGYGRKAILLQNFIDFEDLESSPRDPSLSREDIAPQGEKIVLYTGNFQPYQGIPLLLEAAAHLDQKDVVFLLVGESKSAIARMKQKAKDLNITKRVKFIGQVPPTRIPGYISLADVLVSPRLSGTNTPLKIYSFLKSGKPVVATNLWTHSQVLDENISILVDPDAAGLAKGIFYALNDPGAKKRAESARRLAEAEYTYPKYLNLIGKILKKAKMNFTNKQL
ncbi:MAG: glycosyltransferase family 4 protein [Candidatus Aminicenantes bacterium]|nr:glycosyltransferase family 4 protein [Candidatus Aminicenantes bacterium]